MILDRVDRKGKIFIRLRIILAVRKLLTNLPRILNSYLLFLGIYGFSGFKLWPEFNFGYFVIHAEILWA